MKILLIVDAYMPSPKSAAKHFHDLARELVLQGHEPTILTPSQTVKAGVEVSVEGGIRILKVRTASLKTESRALRAWREMGLSFVVWFRARKILRKSEFDLIAFYSPTIFWGPLAFRLKRLYGCPAYLYLRDIIPKWLLDVGLLRKGPVYYFFRMIELLQYAVADVIAVQAKGDLEHFDSSSIRTRRKLDVVYNWAPEDEGEVPFLDFRGQFGLRGKTIFFFGGTFGRAQDMDAIVRLAISVRNEPSVYFLLAGNGTESARLQAWILRERLENVRIIPLLPQREYLSLVTEVDVGIVALAGNLTTHNVPGKTLSYAFCAKPILASVNANAELKGMLAESNAGFASDAGQDDVFRENALLLARNPDLRKAMGRNARKLLESRFSVDTAIEKLVAATNSQGELRKTSVSLK